MKKADFVTLLAGTAGMLLFALGMCMCLLPQWEAFDQGVILGGGGLAVLLLTALVRRKVLGKPAVKLSRKGLAITALAVVGALVLGVGMCMCMVWEGLLFQGVLVGIVGILLLLCLIPLCVGLR